MRAATLVLTIIVAAVAAEESLSRVPTTVNINQHPESVSLMRSSNLVTYGHICGASILNNRSLLTSARCVAGDVSAPSRLRVRCGSQRLNYGGVVHQANLVIMNNFDPWSIMNDLAIIRLSTILAFNNNVQPGRYAGANYVLLDNQPLTTVGFGYVDFPQWSPNEFYELRRVNQWVINQNTCRTPYQAQGFYIQNSQICSGFYNPSNVAPSYIRNRCFGEPGAPLYHQGIVVGVRSYGLSCFSNAAVPSVNTRVSSHINWIANNA